MSQRVNENIGKRHTRILCLFASLKVCQNAYFRESSSCVRSFLLIFYVKYIHGPMYPMHTYRITIFKNILPLMCKNVTLNNILNFRQVRACTKSPLIFCNNLRNNSNGKWTIIK